MRKKPWTAEEFFVMMVMRLKNNALLPEFLDYSSATSNEHQFKNMDFDVIGIVKFGANEGIYLSMYADYGTSEMIHLGTFKTLDQNDAAFHRMSQLQADFVINAREYITSHEEEFNWEGCDVSFFRDEKCISKLTVSNPDNVLNSIEHFSSYSKYDYVIVKDNETGKTRKISKVC